MRFDKYESNSPLKTQKIIKICNYETFHNLFPKQNDSCHIYSLSTSLSQALFGCCELQV